MPMHPKLLFRDGRRTIAAQLLKLTADPKGLRMPWTYEWNHGAFRRRELMRWMEKIGWIEERRSGPRGGKFWHATEVGCALTAAVDSGYETYRTVFALLYK